MHYLFADASWFDFSNVKKLYIFKVYFGATVHHTPELKQLRERCAFNAGLNPDRRDSDAISNTNPVSANVNNLWTHMAWYLFWNSVSRLNQLICFLKALTLTASTSATLSTLSLSLALTLPVCFLIFRRSI